MDTTSTARRRQSGAFSRGSPEPRLCRTGQGARLTPKPQPLTTRAQALAFVREHGVVLEAARGPVPSLVAAIAGEAIRGSWWAHSRGHAIYELLSAVRESEDLLVCRLVGGKVTLVHRRLWPALVRAAGRFPRKALARVSEMHTAAGRHVARETAFPKWVPKDVARAAARLSEEEALAQLGRRCA